MKEIIIKVEGMVCGGCEKSVQNAVKTIKGIKNVVANYKEETVSILAKESVNIREIIEKIETIGFKVKLEA